MKSLKIKSAARFTKSSKPLSAKSLTPLLLSVTMATLLSLALTACEQAPTSNKEADSTKGSAGKSSQKIPSSVVNVVTARFQTIPQYQTFSGRTVPFETATVVPEVTGIVNEVLFRKGTMVKAGQPLYRINPDNYVTSVAGGKAAIKQSKSKLATAQASQAQAQATLAGSSALLAQAQANVKRYKELLNVNAVSMQAYEQTITAERTARANVQVANASVQQAIANITNAQAGIETAKANMALNKLDLGRTVIKAPITGVTNLSKVDVGSLVSAGQTQLVTITQLNPIYVDISQPSANMLKTRQEIANGQAKQGFNSVELVLEDGSIYTYKGKLALREAQVDETGSVTMRAVFDNSQGVLLPGMFVNARVAQTIITNAILLPQSAIMRTPKGGSQVYIVDSENKIQVRPVTINGTHENNWIVTGGLQPRDNVVVIGGSKVKPQQVVEAKPLPELPNNTVIHTADHAKNHIQNNSIADSITNFAINKKPFNQATRQPKVVTAQPSKINITKPSIIVPTKREEIQKSETKKETKQPAKIQDEKQQNEAIKTNNSNKPQPFEVNIQENTATKDNTASEGFIQPARPNLETKLNTTPTKSDESSAIDEARKEAIAMAGDDSETTTEERK